jgi:porin
MNPRVVRTVGAALACLAVVTADAQNSMLDADAPAFEWSAAYAADLLRNASGGLRVGNAYLDNLEIAASLDAEKQWGWTGWSFAASVLYNNRSRFSEIYSGDAQSASNIDAPRAIRPYEFWAEWRAASTAAGSVRAGLYDLNSEFDVSEARGVFLHSSFGIGHELAQTGANGPSIFPVTGLGVRVAFDPSADWTVRVVALDAVPGDPNDASRTRLAVKSEEGVLLAAEVERRGSRVRKFAAGAWAYSESVERLDEVAAGVDEPRRVRNRGGYLLADFSLWQDSADEERYFDAFVRHGVAAGSANEYRSSSQAGVLFAQPLRIGRANVLGLGVSLADSSEALRRARAVEGLTTRTREAAIELTYRIELAPWLAVQPNLQYIRNPSVDPELDDAFVAGVRLEFSLDWQR